MGQKLKFVLSDLYIGAGYANEGGNELEEFVVDTEFVNFLQEVERESEQSQADVELIINGNLFEFLRVPAVSNYDPTTSYTKAVYHDSSEEASVKRLKIITQGHPEIFVALSNFMRADPPQRRITIIKGNHDVNLFWPRVKNRLRQAVGATGARASLLLFAEDFISREKIYVEHGHQRTERMNRYEDFLDPRHPEEPTQLYYPAGSRFFIDFCNDVEQKYPFANNIKPITTLLWYALRWDSTFAAKLLVSLLHHTPAGVSTNGATPDATPQQVPELLRGLHTETACYDMLQRCNEDADLQQQFFHALHLFLNIGAEGEAVNKTPPPHITYDPFIVGRTVQEQQRSTLHQAAEAIAEQEGARVVLFGHTHHPTQDRLDTGALYINTGCWLNDFSDAPPEVWQAFFNKRYQYAKQPNRLPFARIDYDDEHNPSAQLLDFAEGGLKEVHKLRHLPKRLMGWVNRLMNEPVNI